VEEHAFLFEEGDVEGKAKGDVLKEWGISMQGHGKGEVDVDMEKVVEWAVQEVLGVVERVGRL